MKTRGGNIVKDLDKLNSLKLIYVGFRLEPIFHADPAVSNKNTCFKSGQKRLKKNPVASLV